MKFEFQTGKDTFIRIILKYLKEKLPEYMVPKDILYIKDFPLNSNGKIDIKKLSTKIGEHGEYDKKQNH